MDGLAPVSAGDLAATLPMTSASFGYLRRVPAPRCGGTRGRGDRPRANRTLAQSEGLVSKRSRTLEIEEESPVPAERVFLPAHRRWAPLRVRDGRAPRIHRHGRPDEPRRGWRAGRAAARRIRAFRSPRRAVDSEAAPARRARRCALLGCRSVFRARPHRVRHAAAGTGGGRDKPSRLHDSSRVSRCDSDAQSRARGWRDAGR